MTKFNKRHYQAIAEVLQKATAESANWDQRVAVDRVADRLADLFARDNSNFKRDLFIAATQPGANVKARTVDGALKNMKKTAKYRKAVSDHFAKVADKIDGYDRDDLGESPDF